MISIVGVGAAVGWRVSVVFPTFPVPSTHGTLHNTLGDRMNATAAGRRIRRHRDRRAWTQAHLAQAAGVSLRTVQRAEEGRLSAETLSAIAGALDVEVQQLMPPQWSVPAVRPVLFYARDATLDWLATTFGFEVLVRYPDGHGGLHHAELDVFGGQVMIGGALPDRGWTTPELAGACTHTTYVMVPDVDAHCATARAAGAEILSEPADAHGDRRYLTRDPEGHQWWFVTPSDGS
ncbi:MAG: helix-turn-helix domain-containing protein [Myxococcales bacterium]|nr:helix-turn-helix domain-containing protein [Myxococcales bacterium]